MSLYQKASLVQIPSGYKASSANLYSVVPNNGDGDFTVSSDADATRVNKDGLIESVPANQARLNYDPTNPQDPHLLLEPTRQNYTAYSAQFNNSYWTKATSDTTPNPTVTANAATSPDGGSNADRVQLTAPPNNDWAVVKRDGINTGATVGSKLQQSLYLKAYNSSQVGKKVDIYMYDFSNTVYKTVYNYTLTADWERVVVEHTISGANTSTNIQFAFGKARATVGGSLQSETATDFLVWGAQLEAGSYPTSYIPTSGVAAVTRTVDYASGAGNEGLFNDSEGTLFIEAAALGDDGTNRVINISDGTLSNRVLIQLGGTNNLIRVDLVSGGSTQTILQTTSYNFTNYNKIALKYKENDTALFVNGTQIGTTQTGKTMPTGLDRIDFTNGNLGSTFYFRGKLKQLMYFDTALTNAELITLTS